MNHQHIADSTVHCDGGIVYEVCACGATRRLEPNRPPEPWHACELCTHEWGLR